MQKTILITGGAGFIGSHLCEEFLKQNDKVICLDNLITGQLANINHLLNNPNFKFINADVSDRSSYILHLKSYIFTHILHFASPAGPNPNSPKSYLKYPIETYLVNSIGTHYLLELAQKTGAEFLFASTSEVYGNPLEHPQKEDYWGNVNTLGPRACFSKDTEILTKDGWKFLPNVLLSDEIATLSPIDHKLEYNKPYEIIKEEYSGFMKHFNGYKIEFLVTPNHKIYARKKHKSCKYEFFRADTKMSWQFMKIKTDVAIWNGIEKKNFYLPQVNHKFKNKLINNIKMDHWLEFFGYYISEGCIYERKSKVKSILIAQSRNNKKEWKKINKCLEKLPIKSNYSNHQWFIINKQIYEYLKQFGKAREKYIPKEFKNLSRRQLKILFNALYLGDGSKNRNCYYTASKKLADDIQEICLKIGYSAKITITHANQKRNLLYNIYIRGKQDLGKKYKTKKGFLEPRFGCNPKNVKYNGNVYCVDVPNHIIYVRRNGKAAWCGNCYDESKRFGEMATITFGKKHKINTKIVRIFNTYGPRMNPDDGRVVPQFILQALHNEPITIYGKGQQTRSLCYIDDLIKGIQTILEKAKPYEVLNLGGDQEITVNYLAEKIKQLTNSSSSFSHKGLPLDDPEKRQPDLTKINKLSWQPAITLEQGLIKTIEYFEKIKE